MLESFSHRAKAAARDNRPSSQAKQRGGRIAARRDELHCTALRRALLYWLRAQRQANNWVRLANWLVQHDKLAGSFQERAARDLAPLACSRSIVVFASVSIIFISQPRDGQQRQLLGGSDATSATCVACVRISSSSFRAGQERERHKSGQLAGC